jgi:hypothetical protein
VEKWKTKSRFPTFPPPSLGLNEEKTKSRRLRRRRKREHFYRGKEGDISNEA